MKENDITAAILDAAIEVHRVLGGPGLLESIYEEALVRELLDRGLQVERQKSVPVTYKGKRLAHDLRLDLLVQDKVIVECKASMEHNPVYEAQALTYLRVTGKKVALVINFGEPTIKQELKRIVNRL